VSGRVFLYVQHLLGIGHLRRAATLARALAKGGFDVLLVSGGAPTGLVLEGVRFHQLPPVRAADENLREICRLDGRPLDDAFRVERTHILLDLLVAEAPDILITEQFPFGRTRLQFELLPLLATAKGLPRRPLIACSVRDVVRRSASPRRVAEAVEILQASFDAVLIHADPAFVAFGQSFTGWDRIKACAHYTGYVVEHEAMERPSSAAGSGEVIVSVGGGAVGAPLLRAAIAARPKSILADRTWRLLVGSEQPALGGQQDGIVIEPARPDFTTLLRNSMLSISQAGYNTTIETLTCASRAVLVPFGSARETEQADRAQVLAERGMVAVVAPEALSAESLADAVKRAMAGPSIRSFPPCDTHGGPATAALLHRLLQSERRP
jgi:predicted glycosyltransferase